MVFGEAKRQSQGTSLRVKQDHISQEFNNEGEEGDIESAEKVNAGPRETRRAPKDVEIDPTLLLEDLGIHHDPVLKNFDDLKRESGPKTTFEVSICAPESLIQWKDEEIAGRKDVKFPKTQEQNLRQNREGMDELIGYDGADGTEDDSQSDNSMSDYELPSMPELIQRAFSGDDVEGEFKKEKLDLLNEENHVPEKPMSLPGWGQWTDVQQKRGMPSWILDEHEIAKKAREDADLKHAIISERTNKKVVKRPGVPINPIKFKEVNPLDNESEFKTGKMKDVKKKSSVKKCSIKK